MCDSVQYEGYTAGQETFSASVSQALSAVSSYTEEAEDVEKETNAFVAFFAGMKDDVVALVETAKNMLGLFTDAIAVLLITNCIIPILTAALFVWVLKSAVGINIPTESMVQLVQPKQKKLKKSEERQAS